MNKKHFDITKKNLRLSELYSLIFSQQKVRLSMSSISKIKKSNFLKNKVNQGDSVIYGVNTGFGSLCNTRIDKDNIKRLQENLIFISCMWCW